MGSNSNNNNNNNNNSNKEMNIRALDNFQDWRRNILTRNVEAIQWKRDALREETMYHLNYLDFIV